MLKFLLLLLIPLISFAGSMGRVGGYARPSSYGRSYSASRSSYSYSPSKASVIPKPVTRSYVPISPMRPIVPQPSHFSPQYTPGPAYNPMFPFMMGVVYAHESTPRTIPCDCAQKKEKLPASCLKVCEAKK